MPTENGRVLSSRPRRDAPVAVIAALSVERAGLAHASRADVEFLQSGPGTARAEAAAKAAIAAGAGALVSWGLAGGLAAAAAPGRVVLPATIADSRGAFWRVEPCWHAALRAALAAFDPLTGPLLCAAGVIASPSEKRTAARETGAVAVDMESAGIAAAAAAAGIPFAAVRVVVDGSDDALPTDIERWVAPAGGRRLLPLVGAAVAPRRWGELLTLAARFRRARRTLDAAARCLLGHEFCRDRIGASARVP